MTDDCPGDVNERLTKEWKADTSPGERVRTVIKQTYDAQLVASPSGRWPRR